MDSQVCSAVPEIAAAFGWIPLTAAAPIGLILAFICGKFHEKKKTNKKKEK
jgi:mannose/fructose/N-acetylgalactosamine-specific phosphotransferase system component IIC